MEVVVDRGVNVDEAVACNREDPGVGRRSPLQRRRGPQKLVLDRTWYCQLSVSLGPAPVVCLWPNRAWVPLQRQFKLAPQMLLCNNLQERRGPEGEVRISRIRALLIALGVLPTCLVVPARAENVVRWATPLPAVSVDPYGHDELLTFWVQNLVFDGLTNYDWEGRLEPGLAVSWKRLDALTWEMELRQGITFHDGTPFTSADVVFNIERAKAENSTQRGTVSSIAGVEAVDPDTVRFTAATANPIPWEDVGWLSIMSKDWAERHGAELPSQLGDDRWDYAEMHANGTGPFMLEEFEPGERTVLVRNADWWGLAQHPHNIDRIVQTRVDEPAQGAKLLFAGEIDVLQSPPADQLERIPATPGLKVQKAETNQTFYLGFDEANPELRSSNIKGRNPFADRRVRQAVYQGIDIGRIVEALHGLAVPAGMLIWRRALYDAGGELAAPEADAGELAAVPWVAVA